MTLPITGIINNGLIRGDNLPRDNRATITAYRGESIGLELSLYNIDGTPFLPGVAYTVFAYVSTRSGERVLRVPVSGSTAGLNKNVTNFVISLPRYIVPATYLWELYVSYGDVVEAQVMPASSLIVMQTAR